MNLSRSSICRNTCRFFSSASTSVASASPPDFNRTEENGIAHVTAINVSTNERSIVELKKQEGVRVKRFRKEFVLPDAAVNGLRDALLDCNREPKQLQHEADQMSEKLAQRRFPAPPSVLKKLRDEIKLKIRQEMDEKGDNMDDLVDDEKIREAREYQIRNKVDKILKKSKYNWKPLEFETKEAAAAYSLARIVPNYAEIARCLEEFATTDFKPQTVLDYGSGSGAGFWAVNERWNDLKDFCMVDLNDNMIKFAMDVLRDNEGNLLSNKISFRRNVLPSLQTTYDLVICHRSLVEFGSAESRLQVIESLWRRCNRYLLVIESGNQDSFEALLDARDYLLMNGTRLDHRETIRLLNDHRILTTEMEGLLHDRNLTDFEKFTILREKVPEDITLPTVLPTATVFAPCPHDLGCPLQAKSACTFPIRWRPIRADGKRGSREKSGTETGKFSFVIMEKARRQAHAPISRILEMRKQSGHLTCDVCTSFKGLQRMTISKRAGSLYKLAKARSEGELLPLEITTKATENAFDVFDQIVQTIPPKL